MDGFWYLCVVANCIAISVPENELMPLNACLLGFLLGIAFERRCKEHSFGEADR